MAGALVTTFQTNTPGSFGSSTNVDNYAVDATRVGVMQSLAGGALTNNLPISLITANRTGVRSTCYVDLFYNRIWVIPGLSDFGNLLGNQTISIEVWNSYFVDKELLDVTEVGLDETTLVGDIARTFAALESYTYELTVPLAGNPAFEGYYEWNFEDTEYPRSYAKGKRVVTFPFRVNTAGGIKEVLQWVTSVTQRKRATEQRRRLRKNPRRKLEYTHTFFNEIERQTFRAAMFGWQMRTFALPIWLDRSRLSSNLAAGSTSLTIPTQYLDYDAGGFLLFWQDARNVETVQITGVTSTELTFSPTQKIWAAGTQVMPARLATVSTELQSELHKRNFETATLLWQIQNTEVSTNRIANASYDTYKGYPVYKTKNDFSESVNSTYRLKEQILDALIGSYSLMPETNGHQVTTPFKVLLTSRQAIAEFLGFLNSRAGRFTAVWIPSYQDDFTVIDTIDPTATTFSIEPCGYSTFYAVHPARRDVCFIKPDGSMYYRRITGATAPDNTSEVISIDSSLGFTVTPGDGTRISFLTLCRLDQDNIELNWLTDNKMSVGFGFTDLPTTPA